MTKQIRDNIYGFVELDEEELKVLGHPFFQRLRRIKQNGLLEYLYPAAKHDRFQHSLGVNHLLKLTMSHFEDKKTIIGWEGKIEDHKKELEWAALLHDIGHFPLSHTCEKAAGADHEEFGGWILNNTSIIDKLPEDINPDNIAKIITGDIIRVDVDIEEHPLFVRQLMKSTIDLDRMDYLLRDSCNIGIPYGSVGYKHLIRTSRIVGKEGRLCLEEKGISTADGIILARIQMYTQVYSHVVNDAYTRMMKRVYKEYPEVFPSIEIIKEKVLEDQSFWEQFDDNWIRLKLKEVVNTKPKPFNIYAKMLLNRDHVRLVHERKEWRSKEDKGEHQTKYDLFLSTFEKDEDYPRDCPFKKEYIFSGEASVGFSDVAPMKPIEEEVDINDPEYADEVFIISVKKGWDSPRMLVSLNESITSQLGGKKLYISRVYTLKDKKDEMRKYVIKKCEEKGIQC
jgi:HD superfamily phosphohydrolase